MTNNSTYRTFNESQEEYYRDNPDEIEGYLEVAFEEYAKDQCTPALLSQLRMIARVKGISKIAGETGLTRNGIQKALSEQGNPKFDSINAILNAIGYNLMPQKLIADSF